MNKCCQLEKQTFQLRRGYIPGNWGEIIQHSSHGNKEMRYYKSDTRQSAQDKGEGHVERFTAKLWGFAIRCASINAREVYKERDQEGTIFHTRTQKTERSGGGWQQRRRNNNYRRKVVEGGLKDEGP
jgi:hypothetical protein